MDAIEISSTTTKMIQVEVIERLAYIVEVEECLTLAQHFYTKLNKLFDELLTKNDVFLEAEAEVCDVGFRWTREHIDVCACYAINYFTVGNSLNLG